MNTKKSLLVGVALTSLLAAGALGSSAVAHAEGMGEAGQCHGVNACKGKGWAKMSKVDCEKNPKGHWEPMPEKM